MSTRVCVALVLAGLLVLPRVSFARQPVRDPAVWRTFAERLAPGTLIQVRLKEGQRVKATLLQVRPDSIVIKPKTRVPVDAQAVAFTAIESIEPVERGGIGAGKAALIGVATGAATFFTVLLILVAAIDD